MMMMMMMMVMVTTMMMTMMMLMMVVVDHGGCIKELDNLCCLQLFAFHYPLSLLRKQSLYVIKTHVT